MRKSTAFFASIVMLFSLSLLPAQAQEDQAKKMEEGKKILENWIEAQGGRSNLVKIKDTTTSGTMELIQMGLSGSMVMYQKEPNKIRMDMEVMGTLISQSFNGETAWMTNPQTGAVEEMPEDYQVNLKRQAMGNDTILNPEKYGVTFTLEGTETIGGKDYMILKQTFEDGFENIFYIDPGTNLVYKTKAMGMDAMGMEVETETFMSDYREYEGTMVPYSITINQAGEEFMTMTVTDVKYNSGLEDSLFDLR